MDITKIDDIVALKAIAYDILRERDRLLRDIELVTDRIALLESEKQHSGQADTGPKKKDLRQE